MLKPIHSYLLIHDRFIIYKATKPQDLTAIYVIDTKYLLNANGCYLLPIKEVYKFLKVLQDSTGKNPGILHQHLAKFMIICTNLQGKMPQKKNYQFPSSKQKFYQQSSIINVQKVKKKTNRQEDDPVL